MWDYINSIPESWRYGIIVLLIIVVVVLLARCSVYTKSSCSVELVAKVKYLLQEATRWQAMSKQDQNALYAFMHSNYAVAYANAARQIMSDDDIKKNIGFNMQELTMELDGTQQATHQGLTQLCPSLQPNTTYSIATGWLA